MQTAPETSIIIVNWNSAGYVRKCLNTVYRWLDRNSFEVIVVDGASFDECGEMLAREFPEVIFVQSQENVGFGKANNFGATKARGKYIWFLNPDTELHENTLAILK